MSVLATPLFSSLSNPKCIQPYQTLKPTKHTIIPKQNLEMLKFFSKPKASLSINARKSSEEIIDTELFCENMLPTVVTLSASFRVPSQFGTSRLITGSGTVIRDDGLILSSAHLFYPQLEMFEELKNHSLYLDLEKYPKILTEDDVQLEEIAVTFWDNRELGAKMVGMDCERDLVLLKVVQENGKTEKFSFACLGDPALVKHGTTVFTISNLYAPFSFSHGKVSSPMRTLDDLAKSVEDLPTYMGSGTRMIQTTLMTSKESSGGPLFNALGEIMGVLVFRAELRMSFSVHGCEVITFVSQKFE